MFIVFSDLDGTLLDHFTYSYEEASPGLALLREMRTPLVLVSSKTFPEMKPLHRELGLSSPCVFENGAGIAWSRDDDFLIDVIGSSLEKLREAVPAVEGLLGARIRPITDMTPEEVARATGLSQEKALLAQQRQASLPFILTSDTTVTPDLLREAADSLADQGLTLTRGGRFFHLSSREATKGNAVERVTAFYKGKNPPETVHTVGIGDSENDVPMLKAVDIPILVRKHTGEVIDCGISNVTITAGIGPAGFSEGIRFVAEKK